MCPNCGRTMSSIRYLQDYLFAEYLCDGCTLEIRDYVWVEIEER